MTEIIKISHKGLTAKEIAVQKRLWTSHPAFAIFLSGLSANNIVTPFNNTSYNNGMTAGENDFPLWLKDNILLLAETGIGVSIEMENGVLCSNSLSSDRAGKKFPNRRRALKL